MELPASVKPCGDQVLDDLLLSVDRHVAAGQFGDPDPLRVSLAAEIDAVVGQPLPREPLADPELMHEIDGVLLEQAGTHPPLDVVAVTRLEDHRLDPLALKEERQRQAGRPGADDSDLCPHPAPLARIPVSQFAPIVCDRGCGSPVCRIRCSRDGSRRHVRGHAAVRDDDDLRQPGLDRDPVSHRSPGRHPLRPRAPRGHRRGDGKWVRARPGSSRLRQPAHRAGPRQRGQRDRQCP